MEILLYFDEGVDRFSFRQTYLGIEKMGLKIRRVDHSFFTTSEWEKNTALVVFPGGRDVPYHNKLKGEANLRLRTFIENGGSYLGLCAGAYYGCSEIEFEKSGPLEIVGERELKFFPGKAKGPAYGGGLFSYENESGARLAKIEMGKESFEIYFNGGCLFDEPEKHQSVRVVARYQDIEHNPASIVLCSFGQGKALLSGVHPEYPSPDEQKRSHLWSHLLKLIIP